MKYVEETDPYPVFRELAPMLQEHMDEVNKMYHVDTIDPAWRVYKSLFDMGRLMCVTARIDSTDVVVGYTTTILTRHLHYDILVGHNDIIFLKPKFRGFGRDLIKFTMECLKNRNIQYFSMAVKPHLDFSPVLKRMGYELFETHYIRRLR